MLGKVLGCARGLALLACIVQASAARYAQHGVISVGPTVQHQYLPAQLNHATDPKRRNSHMLKMPAPTAPLDLGGGKKLDITRPYFGMWAGE